MGSRPGVGVAEDGVARGVTVPLARTVLGRDVVVNSVTAVLSWEGFAL